MVSWQRDLRSREQFTTSTDSTGHYQLCGVPTRERIFVRAEAGPLEGAPVTVMFDQDGVWYNRHVCLDVSEADLRRGRAGIQANCFARRELRPTEDLIWRQDFTLGDEPEAIETGTITGVVTDVDASPPQPIAGATVVIVGTSFTARTDSRGAFHIADLPVGSFTIEVRYPEYYSKTYDFEVQSGETLRLPRLVTGLQRMRPR